MVRVGVDERAAPGLTDATPTGAHVTPAPILEAMGAFQVTAVLGAAIRLGIFDAIAAGQSQVDEIAASIAADERATQILLDALAAIRFLEARDDRYALTPVTDAFLVRERPAYIGGLADVYYSDWQWHGHLQLPEAVRAGGTVGGKEQDVETLEHPFWETFATAYTGASTPFAEALADLLAPWAARRSPLEVLDVACGSGIYSLTLADRQPHARVTFLDQANVLPATHRYARELGLADRTTSIDGDMFAIPLGGPYDLAIASHVFHHFSQERCVRLMRRLRDALREGGRLAIHDFAAASSDPAEEPIPRLFSIIMLIRTRQGRAYSVADHQQMLAAAGFTAPEIHSAPGLPTRFIVAQRAG